MSQSIQIQVTQVGLEQSIAAAMKRVGNSSQINLGTSSKQINALSQPLGRITGQADEFSKSMAAANARVLAFGASAGIIAGVSKAMSGLVTSTIKVEKSLVEINSVLNKTGAELDKFGQDIFNVAKNTGKSFDEVANGALELARQGLNAEDTLARLNDALILSRLSGLDAAQSVEGLTAAFNSFQKSGITTSEILNKVVAVSQKYAVSERDIIEGVKRSASVAQQAGVSFDELAAVITAVQQTTARGGAVIGNSFKTIFARIQRKDVLSDLQNMGVAVTDLQGNVLPALRILENLAGQLNNFSQIEQANIAEKLGGVFQLDKLLAALNDISDKSSVTSGALKVMGEAGNSAYQKNIILNQTLAALLNKVAVNAEQLGAKLGEIGVTDSLKNVLGIFNDLLEGIQKVLGEESGLGNLVRGLVKGLGSFLAGPGLALFGGIILKLSKDLVQFGFASLKTFFGIGKAAKEVQNVEGAISQILAKNVNLQQQLFALEGNRAAQLRVITAALVEQEAVLRRSSKISSGLAAPLYNVGARGTASGLRVGNSADGYMPAVAKESQSIRQGVGGARAGDKPVVIPNFSFGGGRKGTMVAHTGEYIVPNFSGSGGTAVFNRQMVQSMGLPSGAKKINAAGGFVPNFVDEANRQRDVKGLGASTVLKSIGFQGDESYDEIFKKIEGKYTGSKVEWVNDKKNAFNIFQNGRQLTSQAITTSAVEKQRSNREVQKAETFYNSNKSPGALMLVPEKLALNSTALNTKFRSKREGSDSIFDGFIGGIAGVDPTPDNNKFAKLTNIDNEIASALSKSAVNILKDFDENIKIKPDSALSPAQILKSVLSEGGEGAYGAFKGALFESVIKLVTKAKGQEGGTLDIDFNSGRESLEAIFGVQGKNYQFADLKNSIGQKEKFISQVMTNLPYSRYPDKKQVGAASAASGFIPNFAKYIYDSDRLAPDKGATLAAILASKVKKNLIIGPAGSGKSTYAGKMGQFLSGIDDVSKASEIDILSGAARAKGGISKNLESIIAAVNASGGKVSYLYTKNLEILSRRMGRTSPSEGDLRSAKQLKGTKYAPLNQFDFLSTVKSKSSNFNLINGASGFLPNFANPLQAAVNREMAAGVPASQIYIDKSPALKNAANPMGLMVANRRDEPAGGFQGINRARREGANPMMYGAAGGFVPNYASLTKTVSQETGIKIYAGPVQDAIDKFAKESLKAGADMKKLAKQLEDQLKIVTQGNPISKQLAQVAQEEMVKRKEIIAAKALESTAGKKVSSKLDKILQEYNQSEKTAKDLAKAQAKAAAALNKTTLNEIKKSAITSSIGSLAATRPGAQPGAGNRDMLGTLFAVQGAMSALTGATDDASNSVARYGNIVADGAGSFATAAFAIQGISQMGGAIGGIASKLGPYGLAISATLAAFSIGGKAIDEYTEVNKFAAASMAKVAEAAQKAAVKLEDLSPTAQATVKESAKNLVSGATNILYKDIITGKQYTGKTEFEGFDNFGFGTSELEKSLQASVNAALAAGVSYDLMWNTIREAAESDGKVTKEEVDSIVTKFAELQTTSDQVKKAFGSLDLNIESGIGKSLISMDRKTVEAYAKRTGDSQYLPAVREKMAPITALKKALAESNPGMDVNSTAGQKLILDQYDMLIQKSKEKSDVEKESTKTFQVNLEKLKTELEFNQKLSKIKNDAFTSEQAIRQAIADIESGGLNEQDKAKAILDLNFALEQQGKIVEGNIQSQENLQKAISSALGESIIDPSAYKSAFNTLFAEIQSSGDLTKALLKNPDEFKKQIADIVNTLKLPPDLVKPLTEGLAESLVLNKDLTEEQRKQLEQALQKLGIDSEQLDITTQRAILERKITEQYDRFKEGRSLDVQIKAVDLANESLSINKEIEQVKNNYLFSEFEKAKKIYDLEKQRFELSKQSVEISGEERQLNLQTSFTETLRNRIRDSALPETKRQELLNAPELYNPDALINKVQTIGGDNNLIDSIRKEQEIQRKREELARKQIEGERAGLIAPSEPGSEQKQRLGFFGGIDASLGQMRDATKVFEYELGEKIPQMFSSGLSEAISSAIEGAKDLDDALREAAYNFVKTINQQLMNNLVNSLIGNISFLPKPAAPVTMASGGKVTGGSGSKDDVPAMLMGGEYVVNKRAVAKYGPQFLEAINNGTLSGYAKGGTVQRGPQGNFYTPGTFGQGSISGKRNLLDFATQSGTSGVFDQIINESGYQAISLEPESSRLSVSGMRSTPMFEATQSAKGQAFDLYLQQYNAEREAKKQKKAQKKALITQLGMMALSAALGPIIGAGAAGFKAAFGAAKAGGATGFQSFLAGTKGIVTGGKIPGMEGNVGGLGNLFSGVGKAFTGDFGGAVNKFKLSQIGTQDQLLSAMKNEKFASYINQQGGFIPKAGAIPELGGIPIGASRGANGVTFNSNDGDIIKNIQGDVGVYGSDIEAGLLPSMQGKSGFFKSIGSGANKIGSIFSNFLGSGYGPFDKDGNYVEEWADNPSKWGISQFVRRATGGTIPSTSGIDTVPAMLSGGEFVMNRSAVQSIGAPNLQSMNAGGTSITSEETSKELNEKLLAKLDELIKVSDSSAAGNITINVAPSGRESQESGSQDASASRQQLARQIKDAVLQVINDEKRIGGSLRR